MRICFYFKMNLSFVPKYGSPSPFPDPPLQRRGPNFWVGINVFLEHFVLRVSYCDRPLSGGVRRPLYVNFFYFNIFSSATAHWILTKLNRNGSWEVPYQSCSIGSDWLQKKVTGSKNRFSKCYFQKSSGLKLQDPRLSYLVYSII